MGSRHDIILLFPLETNDSIEFDRSSALLEDQLVLAGPMAEAPSRAPAESDTRLRHALSSAWHLPVRRRAFLPCLHRLQPSSHHSMIPAARSTLPSSPSS